MKRHLSIFIKFIAIAFVLGILIFCLIPVKSNRVARVILLPIENKLQKKIEFKESRIWLPANIFLEDVSIIDDSGTLYSLGTVDINYNLANILLNKRGVTFCLKDIKLYKNVELFDSVAEMLIISAMPDVEFDEIKGILALHRKTIAINNFYAYNDKMRIRGDGWLDKDGLLDCNINFSFSREITDIVPDAIKVALLKHEDEGWMGIALKVSGNFKRPILHITGDTLKVNIMEKLLTSE